MDMKDTIRDILNDAIHAPSGHNTQPWRFALKKDQIRVFNVPNADNTAYDFKQRGTYIAHGTLLENITIAL